MTKEALLFRIAGIKQKIKREWHFWFGKEPYTIQIGDYMVFDPTSDRNNAQAANDAKVVFSDQIIYSLLFLRAEIIPKSLLLITQYPFPSGDDSSGQNGTFAWKANVIVHTRKTWKQYQLKLLKSQIAFTIKEGV